MRFALVAALVGLLAACGDDTGEGTGGAGGGAGSTTTASTAATGSTSGSGGDPTGAGGDPTGAGGDGGGTTSAGGGGAAAHETVSAPIGPEGGSLEHPLGATLTIPPGALEEVVTIAITDRDPPAAAEDLGAIVGTAFLLEPEGQQFLVPATVEVPYDAAAIPDGADATDLRVLIAPGGTDDFAVLPTARGDGDSLVAQTLHFSEVVSVDPNGDPFEIVTTSPLADATVDAAYAEAVLVSGGTVPQLWGVAAGALPPGLQLVADGDADGGAQLLGAPTTAGTYAFSVRVVDFDGLIAERDFTLDVVDAAPGGVLVSGLSNPGGIAVDATHVYWTEIVAGTVKRAPIGGGATELLAQGQAGPLAVAVDATHVYWSNYQGAAIMRQALSGGAPSAIATGAGQPRSIAIDATDVFFADELGTIRRVSKGGGAVVTLASGQTSPWAVAIDDTSVYWTTNQVSGFVRSVAKDGSSGGAAAQLAFGQGRPAAIAVDDNQVYWTNETDGTVRKSAILSAETSGVIVSGGASFPRMVAVDSTGIYWNDGGTVEAASFGDGQSTLVLGGGQGPIAMATSATHLYWADYAAGTISAAPKPFSAPAISTLVDDVAVDTTAPVSDATHVYYVDGTAIMRAPLSGGAPETLATGQDSVWSLALDTTGVYWATFFEGALRRAPKSGGAPTTLATGLAGARGLVVASDRIFLNHTNEIVEIPLAGGSPVLVAATQGSGCTFAVDATNVYWANPYDGIIRQRAIGGGSVVTLTTVSPGPNAIAIDASHLYWTDFTGGNVRRIPLGGGATETIASGEQTLSGVSLDATHVYWSAGSAIRKAPKAGGAIESVVALRKPGTLQVVGETVVWADWEAILAAPSGGSPLPVDPPPVLASLSRSEARTGSGDLLMSVMGSGFLAGAGVLVDGAPIPTTFLSPTSVQVTIPASMLASLATLELTAENPPGGVGSNALSFDVVDSGNPVPGLVSASPSSTVIPAVGNDVAVTLTGADFVAPIGVWFDGRWIEGPTVVDSSTVSIILPWSDLQQAGSFSIVVHNAAPGGGASPPIAFDVTN